MRASKRSNGPGGDDGATRQEVTNHPPRRVATPARNDRITVEDLLKLAKDGRIRVPGFHRALRWDAEDKWKLLDSMERGYPIGTLLLWKRAASTKDIGSPLPRGPAAPTEGNVYLIVDGQQRIATLWEALALAPEPGQPTIFFDVANEKFVVRALKKTERGPTAPRGDASGPPALPMHLALDAVTLSEWLPSALSREVKVRYYEVAKRLREYLLPTYVVESDDIELLRHVFERTHMTGKPLTRDEVFDALVGSRIASGGERGLGLVQDQLHELGFGTIDRSTILRAFEAIRGETPGELDPRSLDPMAAETDLLDTTHALRQAVAFLRSIGVPHIAVLPYERPLLVLARFFHLYESPDEKTLVLLKRWFWRGAVAGRHGGASSTLQQHVGDVRPDDEHGSVKRLLDRTGYPQEPDLGTIARDEISIASARGKVVLCALFSHAPRDLLSGDKIAPVDLFGGGMEEVMLRIVQPELSKLGSTIANRLLHPAVGVAPSRLLRECSDEGAIASHGIDRAAQRALREGDVATFLERRADVLDEWIRNFVDARAEWNRPDTPSVKVLAQRRRAS